MAGTRVFPGDTISDTLAAVQKMDPNWTRLPGGTPRPIRTLLKRCPGKDRTRRLDSQVAGRLEIDLAQAAASAAKS